ncbi:undecaprenyl-diphosphate phosphatase [Loktanella salsilacus]|jgi:undecaprenyl-diphosphatase|uniref:undecaprenyl-diphosphate phosphatase n=1 Tax=Loktanella salsilacus TaxID=195913 RepID=UPI0020B66E74|nr:undecaprenyl-diphosphate phosphatase [Loktanella salsilacus]MBU1837692.1 undecaprenyl-diphosphate phosphatase [Alphaproteobacteria bacterium]UTH44329.1 undecaprenyl-diphosphate phosphatase [Loktanella salsilacus]|tara:strand:+ start:4320 stop:5126 length:807 start_codon:yes stop_codon:yes gene_type:complete
METHTTLIAAFLGLIEGLTEFIPVSSTGHLLLAGHFLGFESAGKTFEVVIQLGAVLALLTIYFGKLWQVFRDAPRDPAARRFILSVLVAFLPAVFIGVLAHDFIKNVLFETPRLIAVMLVLGGVVLLFVDKIAPEPRHDDATAFPVKMSLIIGFVQCLAMIPGVSRSGATIVGALMLGASKRAAAEFSFFLSLPTMAGAFAYDIYKNRDLLDAGAVNEIVVGLICAFISAVLVVKWLLGFVSRHGYGLFGWWRIIVGSVAFVALSMGF